MREYQVKSNVGGVGDSNAINRVGAGMANSISSELQTSVARSGQELAPVGGAGEDFTQLAKSLFLHSVKAGTFQDTGVANTYKLTPISGAFGVMLPSNYDNLDGARISFIAGNANAGASTINIGQTDSALLGLKKLLDQQGDDLQGGVIQAGRRYDIFYDASADTQNGAWFMAGSEAGSGGGGGGGSTSGLPAGSIVPYAFTDQIPDGFVVADGSLVSRALAPNLAQFVDNSVRSVSDLSWFAGGEISSGSFSTGDLLTTIRVPDFRGRVLRGFDAGAGIDAGREIGDNQDDQMQGHNHRLVVGHNYTIYGNGTGSRYVVAPMDTRTQPTGTAGGDFESDIPSQISCTNVVTDAIDDAINGAPKVGAETRMKNSVAVMLIAI